MNWKDMFSTSILVRGYEYYCSDNVVTLDVESDYIYGEVEGSELYSVEIHLKHGRIQNMSYQKYGKDK